MPKISLIVVTKNQEQFISLQLDSIFCQSYRDFEVIVIDDCSEDNTANKIKSFLPKIKFYSLKPSRGVVNARNYGVLQSCGEYIAFLDGDDLMTSDRLAKSISILDMYPEVGLVYGDADIIDSNGKFLQKFSKLYPVKRGLTCVNLIKHYCFIPSATVIIRRKLFEQLDGPMAHCEYLLWIKIASKSKVFHLNDSLGKWRLHQNNLSDQADFITSQNILYNGLSNLVGNYLNNEKKFLNALKYRRAQQYLLIGLNFISNRNELAGRKNFINGIKTNFFYYKNYLLLILTYLLSKSLLKTLVQHLIKRRAKCLAFRYMK